MPAAKLLRSGFRFGTPELPSDFAHPPLTEVWLGVEFAGATEFPKIRAADWRNKLGPEWPAIRHSLDRIPKIDPTDASAEKSIVREDQIHNVMNDRAIRFRSDGFSFGWLGYDGSMYPRYEAIRDGFVSTLDRVREFVPGIEFPVQTTVSYLNRIPQGTVWTSTRDLSFFRLWQPNPLQKLKIEPDGFSARWQFPLEAERGTLMIELNHQPAINASNEVEAIWIQITARTPTDSTETSLFDGLDFSREMVVRAFNELVTTEAKNYWGVSPRKNSVR